MNCYGGSRQLNHVKNDTLVYGVDVKAKVVPANYVTKLQEKYRAGRARLSSTQYGWIRS